MNLIVKFLLQPGGQYPDHTGGGVPPYPPASQGGLPPMGFTAPSAPPLYGGGGGAAPYPPPGGAYPPPHQQPYGAPPGGAYPPPHQGAAGYPPPQVRNHSMLNMYLLRIVCDTSLGDFMCLSFCNNV